MSADNCIAILATTDKFQKIKEGHFQNTFGKGVPAFRVAHVLAHDSFEYYKDRELHNLGYWLYEAFGKSEVFYKEEDALIAARRLQKEVGYTEYGIISIDANEFNFPGC